jgi:carbon-monoxide dehydrogenase medium subunit
MLDPDVLVDISRIPELSVLEADDDRVRIGAATTYASFQESDLSDRYPAIGEAIAVIADQQVRNVGTIGGAISHADPYLDVVPPLLCHDASVEVQSADETRTMPLAEFCWAYMETDLEGDELLTAIEFDHEPGVHGAYTKASTIHGGWATVGVATTMALDAGGETVENARVALAGVGDTAIRARTVEDALVGTAPTDEAIEAAAETVVEDIDPLGDMTGSAAYKESVARNLTRRGLTDLRDTWSETA